MDKKKHHNPDYIHHQPERDTGLIREIVFGMEDGMVSTLGAVTGIAAATHDPFTTVLSGVVVVSVESISMAVGSYLSSKSVLAIDERKIQEEKQELIDHPEDEEEELKDMYIKDGWSEKCATQMAREAAQNSDLFLQEMSLRELKIIPENMANPFKNGLFMGISYIIGGMIPLTPFFFLSIFDGILTSIVITLIALFILGAYTATFSKRNWVKAGFEMFALASAAALVGYIMGQLVDRFLMR